MIRKINGVDYSFEQNSRGWAVGCRSALTDRFYRNYQVLTASNGRPMSCSCPDCHYRRNWCKHLREVEAIIKEQAAASSVPSRSE